MPGCDTSPRANILFGLNEETPDLYLKMKLHYYLHLS